MGAGYDPVFLMVCAVISVIGTYSRGGLVGLSVIVLMLLTKSRHKVIGISMVCIGLLAVVLFTTSQWKERMDSFAHGNLDMSAESRLTVWLAGWKLVQDYPLTGGGFDVYTDSAVLSPYIPDADKFLYGQHGPHSIYFQTLGEQGFVGLGLFIGLMLSCLASLRTLRRRAAGNPEFAWAVPYTHMFEVSLLAYMANGATLGRAYFDFFYQIVACVIILKIVCQREANMLLNPPLVASEDLEAIAV